MLESMHGTCFLLNGRQVNKCLSAFAIFFLLLIAPRIYSQTSDTKTLKKRDLTTRIWLGSHVLPGYGQAYNKQYWKIPIFYAGMGAMAYQGYQMNSDYKKWRKEYLALPADDPNREAFNINATEYRQKRNLYYAAATAFYLASVSDAVLVYNRGKHSPATASILSTLVPGMGQAYNGAYWKIPVIYGGLSTFYFMIDWNNRGYKRFKTALFNLIDDDPDTQDEFNGTRTKEELRYYMDSYRRNRDLSALGFAVVYVLNIIDANVDGYLYDWNVDDNLTFRVEPAVFNPSQNLTYSTPAFGVSCRVTF